MESFQERILQAIHIYCCLLYCINIQLFKYKKHIFSFWYGCYFKAIYKEIDEWVFELI